MSSDHKYISPEQQEEFEKFLLHKMNLEEETLFNKKLNAEPDLKSQFEDFKALFFAVEEEGLRNALNEFHKSIPKKKNNFTFYRIAAGITVLVSLGIWFFNGQSPNEKLFNEYFTPDPGLPTVMGSNDNYAFYEAMVDYKQGNYEIAIEKWERLMEEKSENDTLNYFLGVAHLANGNEQSAISFLEKVLPKDSFLEKEAQYYLGLAYLKANENNLAKEALSKSDTEKRDELIDKISSQN